MTLYSHQGREPKPLPFRITLSDGRTRTDTSSFTVEEIADAGYVEVEEKPIVYYPQYVIWNGSAWVVQEYSLEQLKLAKKQELTAYRYEQEISHPNIDTTRESQSMINAVWTASQIDPAIVVNFKNKDGSWAQLNAELINIVSRQVISHVQECFNNEKLISEQIDSCTTVQELMSIDIRQGWPDYSVVEQPEEESDLLPPE
jgi:hypothetical protein